MTLLDLMALTPVAPEHTHRFGIKPDEATLRAYRAAVWHWTGDDTADVIYLAAHR